MMLVTTTINLECSFCYGITVDNYAQWINDISMPEIWNYMKDDGLPIVIAILDTGLNTEDYCFKNRVIHKYNIIEKNSNVSDTIGHGTWVTSICLGNHDDKRGIYGINPKANIMAIKITDDNGECNPEIMSEGIYYAVDNGAKIINISLGSQYYSRSLESAVNYANKNGCLIVSCSGNESKMELQYPARFSGVISVGASHNKDKAFFSNYGQGLNILAPGMFIRGANLDGGYVERMGTSASVPIVSGILSLILSKYPYISKQQLEKCIYYSASDIDKGAYNYNCGRDIYSGFGIINAHKALLAAKSLSNNSLDNIQVDKFDKKWYNEAVLFCIVNRIIDKDEFIPSHYISKNKLSKIFCNLEKCINTNDFECNSNINIKLIEFSEIEIINRISLLYILFKDLNIEVPETNIYSNIFNDFKEAPYRFQNILTYAFQKGYIEGVTKDSFNPNSTATYAELYQVIYNMYLYEVISNAG